MFCAKIQKGDETRNYPIQRYINITSDIVVAFKMSGTQALATL